MKTIDLRTFLCFALFVLVFRPYFSGIRELGRLPSSLVLPSFFGLDFCYHATPLLFFENVFVNHILWGEMLRRFSCRGYRTWPCLSCRVGYRCSLYCCLHVTFHLTIPASLLLPLPFAICIYANLLPFCSAFCQLTAYLFSIFTHSFSDCSLGNCHLFLLSFRTWNNFSHWILLSQLAGKKLFRYVLRLFIVFCSSYVLLLR